MEEKAKDSALHTSEVSGAKEWSCSISIAYELVSLPAYRLSTLFHESLHALSPTTREQYKLAPGWEEAVIENAVRLHQANLAHQLGLSISQEQFDERNKDNAYPGIVKSLEQLRIGLKYNNKSDFYDKLMRLPATEKKEFIRSEARKLPPKDLEDFRPIFAHHARILDEYKRPSHEQSDGIKGELSSMNQEDVITLILSARTKEQIIHAQQVMMEWMKDHPRDFKVLSGGEQLAMLLECYEDPNPDSDIEYSYSTEI